MVFAEFQQLTLPSGKAAVVFRRIQGRVSENWCGDGCLAVWLFGCLAEEPSEGL
jgi:hypothetical protein